MSVQADFQAKDVYFEGLKSNFLVFFKERELGRMVLNLPGIHNVSNALAAVGVGMELGIGFEKIREALASVQGVQRRLEIKGEVRGITVVDDYGHHPTEIKTTLDAVKQSWPGRRTVVVFQPHRYTRTRALFEEFTRAFYQSDILLVVPIYAASEPEIEGVSGRILSEGIQAHGHKEVHYVKDLEIVPEVLEGILQSGDLLLTLGAGDVWKAGEKVIERLG